MSFVVIEGRTKIEPIDVSEAIKADALNAKSWVMWASPCMDTIQAKRTVKARRIREGRYFMMNPGWGLSHTHIMTCIKLTVYRLTIAIIKTNLAKCGLGLQFNRLFFFDYFLTQDLF